MSKSLRRALSYSTVKHSRRIEVLSIVCIAVFIVVGVLTAVFVRRNKQINREGSVKCGPKFPYFSVNITGARSYGEAGYIMKDGTVFPEGTFWEANGSLFGCPCLIKPCIRKCCPANQKYNAFNVTCDDASSTLFSPFARDVFKLPNSNETLEELKPLNISEDHFFTFFGDICGENGKYILDSTLYPDDENFLLENGSILTTGSSVLLDQSQYCLESTTDNNSTIFTFECFEAPPPGQSTKEDDWVYLVLVIGMTVSLPFLLTTFVVYALIPQLQNLHGKALMSHVSCLLLAYVALILVQIGEIELPSRNCHIVAFIMQFGFLASFFWLNVMCFDIWWVFSGLMPLRGSIKEAEHQKFLIYSGYAWGCPILIFIATAMIELLPGIPNNFLKPGFGSRGSCWFRDFDGQVVYFYLPIGVLVSLNVMMFLTTTCRLYSHTSQSKVLRTGDSRRHCHKDKEIFNLYLKLSLVMGINWVMEVVSFGIGGPKVIWLVSDVGNTLQGLFIFLIFVCKRRILYQLNQRICPRLKLIQPTTSMKLHSYPNSNSSRYSRSTTMSTNI